MEAALSSQQKALNINLDAKKFGTFAEIGAGQEVVRWFFHVGHASATVAKAISAYDMAVSNELYGPAEHYVSRWRLTAMLDHEYSLLTARLDPERGDRTTFFVFADTAATQARTAGHGGHAWFGVKFQSEPRAEPSLILAHVQLLDITSLDQQAALGVIGVNLVYGALFHHDEPDRIVCGLMDGLRRQRVEVDMVRFSGPAFDRVDNRLISLRLVEQNLTDATIFTVDGEVEQPAEILSGKPVLVGRGGFRPVTNVTRDMLDRALEQIREDPAVESKDPVVLAEMTLNSLTLGKVIDHQDFLARVDTLSAVGKTVLISNYTRFDSVTSYLRKCTRNWIAMVMGAPALLEIFDEKYYTDLEGGILEGLGRLAQGKVRLFVYPMKTAESGPVIDARSLPIDAGLEKLYGYLLESGKIEPIRKFDEDQLHVYPDEVLGMIQTGEAGWDRLVPPAVAALIRERKLFGYPGETPAPPATP